MHKNINKVAIIGTGFVGSTTAYTLLLSGLISEIVLIDANKEKAEGELMDLNHSMPFVQPVKIINGEYSDCAGCGIVIIAAGANQKQGETRIDLVKKNTQIFNSIIPQVVKYNNDCILLVVTNPVDILTYVTWKISGFPKNKVIGSGTVLDTARFKYLLAETIGVDARNIHAYVIGEHGDTEVLAWSLTNIAGMTLDEFCEESDSCKKFINRDEIYDDVKNAAYQIIQKKGATYYAVAVAVRRIVEAILRDESSILTVSSHLDGQYGINDICLSVPTIVNRNGISKVLEVNINDAEKKLLTQSALSLKEIANTLNFD